MKRKVMATTTTVVSGLVTDIKPSMFKPKPTPDIASYFVHGGDSMQTQQVSWPSGAGHTPLRLQLGAPDLRVAARRYCGCNRSGVCRV